MPDFPYQLEISEKKCEKLLNLWHKRSHKSAKVHYAASIIKFRWNRVLTIINAFASIFVLFFTNAIWIKNAISENGGENYYIIASSITGVILVSTTILQYLLNFEDSANGHKMAAAEFSNLHRKIERYLVIKKFTMGMLHNINREYNYITKSYPIVSERLWNSANFGELQKQIRDAEVELGINEKNPE